MTEVSRNISEYGGIKMDTSYFPSIPPRAPRATLSYNLSVQDAPYTALAGVVVDGRQPSRLDVRDEKSVHPVTSRCRVRKQVGCTNRWRLPQSLGSDLLGTTQAIKAVNTPYNSSLMNIITAENPKTNVNRDVTEPYKFRVEDDRPITCPAGKQDTMKHKAPPSTAPAKFTSVGPVVRFTPSTARPSKPMDIFLYHSKRNTTNNMHNPPGPTTPRDTKPPTITSTDVLLQCLGLSWELHRPYLQKSDTLADLLQELTNPQQQPVTYFKNHLSDKLDNFISKNNMYSSEYKEMSNHNVDAVTVPSPAKPQHLNSETRTSKNMSVISLDITDPMITPTALAIALGNMYHDDIEVDLPEVVAVLAAAHVLNFKHLEKGCGQMMLQTISSHTVCLYHQAAVKYQQDHVEAACDRWLEMNLVPKLSTQIQLRQLPMTLLHKILKSNRLFTFGEFSLYRVLAYWVFMQLNPRIQLMPSYATVLTYFNSLPKSTALLEREEGEIFLPLFMCLRLHGVTETSHIQDIQTMNIVPQQWIVKILAQHYHALQAGGDFFLLNNFMSGAIRQGFLIDDEPHYHSEVFSLHGFHFELKAVRQNEPGSYSFFLQRLKPSDPVLSFRQCERHTFSMRPDRDVNYAIRVQYVDAYHRSQEHSTPMKTQRFGLGTKTSRSEVICLDGLQTPFYVTFSIHFPPS